MQSEIDSLDTTSEVRILGINDAGKESGNEQMTEGRTLPWLQDTEEQDVWQDWTVTWRDVVILNPENQPVAVYNLTTYDLREPANYDSLKSLLLSFAE